MGVRNIRISGYARAFNASPRHRVLSSFTADLTWKSLISVGCSQITSSSGRDAVGILPNTNFSGQAQDEA
ncbi:hypothetical protein BD410DRAFT_787997, partial [Rickenella mellea]